MDKDLKWMDKVGAETDGRITLSEREMDRVWQLAIAKSQKHSSLEWAFASAFQEVATLRWKISKGMLTLEDKTAFTEELAPYPHADAREIETPPHLTAVLLSTLEGNAVMVRKKPGIDEDGLAAIDAKYRD